MFDRFALFLIASAALSGTLSAQAPSHARAISARREPAKLHLAPLSPEEQATQVVSRFTFGATPGLVRVVATEGWEQWLDQQLTPDTIPDPALAKRLADYPTLQLSPQELAVRFPDGQVIRRIADNKEPMPADPQLAEVYEVLLARYQAKQAREREATLAPPAAAPPAAAPPADGVAKQQATDDADKAAARARATDLAGPVLVLPAPARLNAVLALPVPDRVILTGSLKEPLRTELLQGTSPHDRELWQAMAGGYGANGVVAGELEQGKILRAVLSERQLQEVMTDFWMNHFNIDLGKSGDEILYANQYEQAAIRPHALGKFRDLLLASAESPAMMIYLDNHTSVGPDSPAAGHAKRNAAGLNENYGREVMELHTIGVDGGYSQADVTALADILTGWGVDRPQQGGPFLFQQRRHEPGTKHWMGQTIAEAGQQEGIAALSYLASSPATARHISFELAQRFVSDTPPATLVNAMVATWMGTDGDIASVLRTMVHSREFFDRANFHNKVKSPLEFVASTMRATGSDPANPGVLVQQLKAMGEPLYRCLPPTGYPNTGEQWMNSAALIDRLNFALSLSAGKLGGMHLDAPLLVASGLMTEQPTVADAPRHTVALSTREPGKSGEDEALLLMEKSLVNGAVSSQTAGVIHAQLAQRDPADTAGALEAMAAMLLGSPEFQVH